MALTYEQALEEQRRLLAYAQSKGPEAVRAMYPNGASEEVLQQRAALRAEVSRMPGPDKGYELTDTTATHHGTGQQITLSSIGYKGGGGGQDNSGQVLSGLKQQSTQSNALKLSYEPQQAEPVQTVAQPEPVEPQFSDPAWILDTWRKLYYNFPSAGLKKRVSEVEDWVETLA